MLTGYVHQRGQATRGIPSCLILYLKNPEPDMGERRKRIIANVLASRLLGVAHKFTLFIIVDGFATDGGQHDAENYQYGQPDLPHEGGVVGDLVQQPRQEAPTHGAEETGALNQTWWNKRYKALMGRFTTDFLTEQTTCSACFVRAFAPVECTTCKTQHEPRADVMQLSSLQYLPFLLGKPYKF